MYKNKTIKVYLDDLAAKKPAPGGGSAAALAAALGASLLSMVANFTVGKASHKARLVRRSSWRKKYMKQEQEIKSSLKKSEKIRKKLLELVDLDVITYNKVAKNKKNSLALYQKSLKEAANVPLKITQNSLEALELCPILEAKGNKYLVSDVHVAEALLRAAVKSAILNVKINLPFIKDKNFVSKVNQQLKSWRI